jgi:aspartyl-tRNA(Asn)/glutamyl-tRNA(Gln) amidotransferase subunit C
MIGKDQVCKIADLARLTLNNDETERYAKELSQILEYVESLNQIDVTGINPTAHAVEVQNVFRVDETLESGVIGKVLEHAPKTEENFFLVPKVL